MTRPFESPRFLQIGAGRHDLTPILDHIVVDRAEQIRDDAKAIKQLSESVPVIVAMSNHFAGYSP